MTYSTDGYYKPKTKNVNRLKKFLMLEKTKKEKDGKRNIR